MGEFEAKTTVSVCK